LPGAGLKAINKRIRSVKSTQQITKAMKMVAAAKLQRSQGRMLNARPYAQKLVELLQQLAGGGDDQTRHPLFEQREVKRRLFIVITSDKGLCGAYNMNIMRLAKTAADRSVADGVETQIYAVGKKARDYFRRREYSLFAEHVDFGGDATAERSNLVGDAVVKAFLAGEVDEVRLVYSQFFSTVRQAPTDAQMLPIAADAAKGEEATGPQKDYIWEPGPEQLFQHLIPLYLRNRLFMTLSEAFVSEHAARMTSMTAATENAGELIDALTMKRNRERQAAITAELSDIVGGANAL
jgi:F-type H+-transporting ATPase subunit gamma